MKSAAPSIVALISVGWAGSCLAQTATLTVSHNDPDGFVAPGETVQIKAVLQWTGPRALWDIRGDLAASPNLGTAANNEFPYSLPGIPTLVINPGTPSNGSLLGVQIRYGDLFWLGVGQPPTPPFGNSTGVTIVQYDWTAPLVPGPIDFGWIAEPSMPEPLMVYQGTAQPLLPIPTTYLGTSLTVVPAPASALLLAYGMLAAPRRRRGAC